MSKVDEFLKRAEAFTEEQGAKYKEYRGRRGKELEHWHTWNDGGRKPTDLAPLLKSIDPLIKSETTKRLGGLGGSIPRGALHNELRNAAIRAIHSFDPGKAQLSTHITNGFRATSDFIAANRNERYMPREHVDTYQQFQNAKNELEEELGREPTHKELLPKLPGWTLPKVQKMSKGFGAEIYSDMGTEFDGAVSALRPRDALVLIKGKLTPLEHSFANLQFPEEGPGDSVKQIAKKLGISADKAYRIKAKVENHLAGILKKE